VPAFCRPRPDHTEKRISSVDQVNHNPRCIGTGTQAQSLAQEQQYLYPVACHVARSPSTQSALKYWMEQRALASERVTLLVAQVLRQRVVAGKEVPAWPFWFWFLILSLLSRARVGFFIWSVCSRINGAPPATHFPHPRHYLWRCNILYSQVLYRTRRNPRSSTQPEKIALGQSSKQKKDPDLVDRGLFAGRGPEPSKGLFS